MTAEAAAKDISYSQEKLGEAERFPRKAVITDKQWMKVLIKKIDPLVLPDTGASASSLGHISRDTSRRLRRLILDKTAQ